VVGTSRSDSVVPGSDDGPSNSVALSQIYTSSIDCSSGSKVATLGRFELLNSAMNEPDSSFVGLDGLVESGLMDSLDKVGQSSGILSHSEHSPDSVGASCTDASVQSNMMAFSPKPLSVILLISQTCHKSSFMDTLATLVNVNSSLDTRSLSLGSLEFLSSSSN